MDNCALTPRSGTFVPDEESPYVAPFVPTPPDVVDRMLELAQVTRTDLVFALGSGDGRIVRAAAGKYGARAVGFEIGPPLVSYSRRKVKDAGLEKLVQIRQQDLRTVDISPATVVIAFLSAAANLQLQATMMRQLRPAARLICLNFRMGDWKPDYIHRMTDSLGFLRILYLWRPAERSCARVIHS